MGSMPTRSMGEEIMEEEIKRFKEQSNGVTYTNKELIGGIHIKLDKIAERLTKGEKKFARLETTDVWHTRLILALYAVLGAFLIRPVRSFIKYIGGFL
ncbi:hypothetical protein LCGC14_1688610 [marine sediment metagenome]|uniref:Uncharacterized protein n=1 Tax=marine sediment metagenome TaxID=412755 RepID=A0A0F9HLK9_9ZZZZ